MNLICAYLKEESIESSLRVYQQYQAQISKYLKQHQVKAIGNYLGITEDQTKAVIIHSLDKLSLNHKLGWGHKGFNKHHTSWLYLLRTCIDEENSLKKWEMAKSLICDAIIEWCEGDLIKGAEEIIREPRIFIPDGSIYQLDIPLFVEYCLRTFILLSKNNISFPEHVIINWSWGPPNFCQWNFVQNGILFEITLNDGTIKEKFIPKTKIKDGSDLGYFDLGLSLFSLGEDEPSQRITLEEAKSFLLEFVRLPESLKLQRDEDIIPLLLHYVKLEKIEEWLGEKSGKTYGTQEEVEKELESALKKPAETRPLAKEYFPEYLDNYKGYDMVTDPSWKPQESFFDLEKLKLDLREFYLSRLSKEEVSITLKRLLPSLGFDIFSYQQFRNIIKEWKSNVRIRSKQENYEDEDYADQNIQLQLQYLQKMYDYANQNIQFILESLQKTYSRSEIKKMKTKQAYVYLCLEAIKIKLERKCTFYQGCKILSQNLNNDKKLKLPLKAKLTHETIKSRSYDLAREEGLNHLKTEKDLRFLQKRLHEKYMIGSEL